MAGACHGVFWGLVLVFISSSPDGLVLSVFVGHTQIILWTTLRKFVSCLSLLVQSESEVRPGMCPLLLLGACLNASPLQMACALFGPAP